MKVLFIEDSEQDALLILREFKRNAIEVEWARVWSEPELRKTLESKWDAILCDYNMPGFGAPQALALKKELGIDLPFIIVSGVIGEEIAVEAMRSGAQDYVLKSNLSRLIPAIEREIKEFQSRQAKREIQESLDRTLVALRRSEAKYRKLAEASALGVVIADFNGNLIEVNDAFLKIVGYPREDFEGGGLKWNEITPPKYAPLEKERIEEGQRRGACTPYEKEYICKDGHLVPVLVGFALLEDTTDQCIAFIADLTERKQIELQLQKAVSARDEFLSIASHELKTPLTSLMLQLQLVLRKINKNKGESLLARELESGLANSQRQLKRLNSLIEDLLDVSRIAHGRLSVRAEEFDLADLIEEVSQRFHESLSVAGCTLNLKVQVGTRVTWDRHRIDQVLANLLSNAIKYAPGREVEIRAFNRGTRTIIEVADQGPGIPIEKQPLIFERFERASNNGVAGLGLGLFIVREIVQSHGGEITVRSEPGKGAIFEATLPTQLNLEKWTSVKIHGTN